MYEIDEQQIRQWWQVFKDGSKLVEIRLLGSNTYSGYFKDVNTLISALRPMLDHNNARYYGHLQAYFTLNDIDDDLYGREQHDKFVKKPKATTSDGNVIRRRFIMLDFDACRVAGVSANDQEFEKAHMKAVEVYRYLMGQGFKEPIITTSGNGWHEYLTCDMPNDDEHNELVKNFLKSLGNMFSDEHVEIDEKVYNPARIDKMIGSWAKKGCDTQDRKWRMAKIVKIPQDLTPNKDELFKKIADLLPKEEPKQAPQSNSSWNRYGEKFNLENWLNTYGIEYRKKQEGSSIKYEIKECPWKDQHSSNNPYSSALFQDSDGKITYTCAHSHCKDKQWKDFRQVYEPDAYSKPQYQPQQYPPQTRQYAVPQRPKYEIKDEIPELGEKWKCFSSIQKIDLTKLEKVKTGFVELDKKIGGLYMSEVTVLSGSNGGGKSSWLNSVLLNIVEQGYKVALWSGELRADILKTWIQMVAAGKNNLRQSQYDDGRFYVPDNIGEKIDQWLDGKFFLYNNEYGNVASQIINDVKTLASAGVKVFVIDNLMATNLDCYDGDKNDRQKQYILDLKDIAMKEKLHIIVVAHPRKSIAFLRKNDISGTGDIINAVDNCFIFHRCNEDFQHAISEFYTPQIANYYAQFGNVLSVEKNRLMGVVDYMCGFFYEIESRRFKNEINENVHYGWEQEPTQATFDFPNQPQQYPQQSAYAPPQGMVEDQEYLLHSQSIMERQSAMPFEGNHGEEAPF